MHSILPLTNLCLKTLAKTPLPIPVLPGQGSVSSSPPLQVNVRMTIRFAICKCAL